MATLDRRFYLAAMAGILAILAISYGGIALGLPTSLPGFVIGVWVYMLAHGREMDVKESAAFSVFFSTAFMVFLFFGGLILLLAGILPYGVVVNAFPLDLGICFLLDIALTLMVGGASGALYWAVRQRIIPSRPRHPPSA